MPGTQSPTPPTRHVKPHRTWAEVEAAARARGWKRDGHDRTGPCPVTGAGKTKTWCGPGERTSVRVGCRVCGGIGGRLEPAALRAHLDALCGAPQAGRTEAPAPPATAPERPVSPLPGNVWLKTQPAGDNVRCYLRARGVWHPEDGPPPPAVRWLSAAAARAVRLHPYLPAAAVGAIVYRYAGPGEADTHAAAVEALDADSRPHLFTIRDRTAKRPSVTGSDFDRGRRVFTARTADTDQPAPGCWLAEGPLDALALVRLDRIRDMSVDLAGAAVYGAHSTAGFTVRALHERGPAYVTPDHDAGGKDAYTRLFAELRAAGREHRLELPPKGMDWADFAQELSIEREAIQHEYNE